MNILPVNIDLDLDNYFYQNEDILFPAIIDNKYKVAYLKLNKEKIKDFQELINNENKSNQEIVQEKDKYLEYNEEHQYLNNISSDAVFLSILEQKHSLKNIIFALNFL